MYQYGTGRGGYAGRTRRYTYGQAYGAAGANRGLRRTGGRQQGGRVSMPRRWLGNIAVVLHLPWLFVQGMYRAIFSQSALQTHYLCK